MDPAQVVQNQIPKKKNPLIPILLAIIIILIGIVAWVLLSQKNNPAKTTEKVATTSSKTETVAPSAATTETPVVDDTALITKALVTKTGIAANIIDVTVSTKTDKLAKGLISAKGEEVGGGYFLAAKVNDGWVIVFDGQSTPPCASINPYNFPASMVPECVDVSGNLVTR